MAYYDPITGEYKEGEDPSAAPPSPTAAIAASAPDPKAGFVKVGSTGDQNRDNMIQAFMRGMQERSVLLNKDPSEVLDTMLDKVGPGKVMLTNMLHGAGAALLNQPFKTVRESLLDRLVEQQKINLQKQQNDSLRLTQFMQMQSREGIAEDSNRTKAEIEAERLAQRKLESEQRFQQTKETLEQRQAEADRKFALAEEQAKLAITREERAAILDAARAEHWKAQDQIAKARGEARVAAGKERNYQGIDDMSQFMVSFGNNVNTTSKFRRQDLQDFTRDQARQWDEAMKMEPGRDRNVRLNSITKSMQGRIFSIVEGDMSAENEKAYNYRFDTIEDVRKAKDILKKIQKAGGDTGPITGKLEQLKRKWGGADEDYTRLYAILRENFQRFRNVKSGAAFGENESFDYESVRALADKPGETNAVLLDLMERSAVEQTVREIADKDPNALRFFIKEDEDGNPGIVLKGVSFGAREYPWLVDVLKRYGL